jgi:hypothetical protein
LQRTQQDIPAMLLLYISCIPGSQLGEPPLTVTIICLFFTPNCPAVLAANFAVEGYVSGP